MIKVWWVPWPRVPCARAIVTTCDPPYRIKRTHRSVCRLAWFYISRTAYHHVFMGLSLSFVNPRLPYLSHWRDLRKVRKRRYLYLLLLHVSAKIRRPYLSLLAHPYHVKVFESIFIYRLPQLLATLWLLKYVVAICGWFYCSNLPFSAKNYTQLW